MAEKEQHFETEKKDPDNKSDKFEKFQELEEKYNKLFAKIIFNKNIWQGKMPLLQVLQKKQAKEPEKRLKILKDIIESKIYSAIEYYSVAQYTYMQRTGDWTEAGQDRVKLCYIRLLLEIPESKEVTFQQYSEFEQKIRKQQEKMGVLSLSDEDLRFRIDRPKIQVLGKYYGYNQTEDLNNILKIIGSTKRVMCGESGAFKSLILAEAVSVKQDKYDVHFFTHEYIRTPNNVHYIVAVIEQEQIAIRHQVCKYVFYNKWLPVFDTDIFQLEEFAALPEIEIAENLKKYTADLFEAFSREEFEEKIQEFLDSMTENLMYHEIAHNAMEELNFNLEEMALVAGISTQKETILSVMNEVLTEWMPDVNNVCGPMKNILNTVFVRNNPKKAKQMLMIYLSDAWFLDTDTTFMYPYNYVMFVIMLKYMEGNREVDFINLYNDFNHIFDFMVKWYRNVLSDVMKKVKTLQYKQGGKTKTFQDLKEYVDDIIKNFEEKTEFIETSEGRIANRFWMNAFLELEKIDKTAVNEIVEFVEGLTDDLYDILMREFASKEDVEKYGSDVKSYVIDKTREVGFKYD